ncbi:hypothetical protein [Streptosporangium sp. NPDC051022]|uniref:hypothetical protein n=1 Tax=Streptosporangium sp. NPDC051022 TaxID=3155752 RepID=UPI0034279DC6
MFTDWLAEFGIPVVVVRGFSSQSYVEILRRRTHLDPRPAVLLYVGDFDASGEDIERDWIARTGCWAHAERVLLTGEQTRTRGLPAAEGKRDDPRWPAFAARHDLDPDRPVQWEVEALEPVELQRALLTAVEPYVDHRILAAVLAEEDRQRRELRAFVARRDAPRDRGTGRGLSGLYRPQP